MFTLTSAAAEQIQESARRSAAHDLALRIAARQVDDGSIEYGMGFDDAREDDMRLQIEGVAVVIADPHQPLLEDITLDFVELEPGAFNFIFISGQAEAQPTAEPGGCGSGGCSACGG